MNVHGLIHQGMANGFSNYYSLTSKSEKDGEIDTLDNVKSLRAKEMGPYFTL